MYIFGAGGQAKVIASYMVANSIEIKGFVVSKVTRDSFMGYKVISQDEFNEIGGQEIIIGIGDNLTRKNISNMLSVKTYGEFIHPSSVVTKAFVGNGSVVFANAVLNVDSKIGNHCIINTNATIEHDCIINDYVHISPNVTLTGNVTVGEGTHIGAGAVVIPGVKIGKWVTVGAGSVVIKDIPDYAVVVGNPARIIKYNEEN